MKETKLSAQPRTAKGSAMAGRLRRSGWFPAVVYGEGRPGVDIQLNEHDFVMMLRRHRSENMILDLTVEGTEAPFKVMLKAMQHHPITGRVIHVDFYEVSMTRKIEIEVPVQLVGVPTGVANEGGILEHVLRALKVECLPGDALEELDLDVSGLAVGKTLRVRDIEVDASKHRVIDDPDQVVAAVAAPRVEKTETEEAEGEGDAAGPEVLTEKKDEEGEAGAGKEAKEPAKEEKKEKK